MRTAALFSLVAAASCTSSSPSQPSCKIDGTYLVRHTKDVAEPGTCQVPNDLDGPDTMTIAANGSGSVTIVLAGTHDTCNGDSWTVKH